MAQKADVQLFIPETKLIKILKNTNQIAMKHYGIVNKIKKINQKKNVTGREMFT